MPVPDPKTTPPAPVPANDTEGIGKGGLLRVAAAATGFVAATAVRYSVEVCALVRKLRSSLLILVRLIGEIVVADVRAVV